MRFKCHVCCSPNPTNMFPSRCHETDYLNYNNQSQNQPMADYINFGITKMIPLILSKLWLGGIFGDWRTQPSSFLWEYESMWHKKNTRYKTSPLVLKILLLTREKELTWHYKNFHDVPIFLVPPHWSIFNKAKLSTEAFYLCEAMHKPRYRTIGEF